MSRNALLQQKKEKEDALKEISQKFKDPSGIKYDIFYESGDKAGYLEYQPKDDKVFLSAGSTGTSIDGSILKSLRDVLNKLIDE